MDKLKSDVVSIIRACLISKKGLMPLRDLNEDYRLIIGEYIPYSKCGFRKLEEFIQSEPTLRLVDNGNGLFVDAKISQKSAHISELVSKQKTDRKRTQYRAPRFANSRPIKTTNWRPKHQSNQYQRSSRPAEYSHNQFVNSPRTPSVASKVVVPEATLLYKKQMSEIQARLKQNENVPVVNGTAHTRKNVKVNEVPAEAGSSSSSARKRIMNKVLNVERDSGSSNGGSPPVIEVTVNNVGNDRPTITAPASPQILETTGNPVQDLENFVKYHTLGEIKKNIINLGKKKQRFYSCKITVGSQMFSTYPEEFHTQAEAEKSCAKLALSALEVSCSKKKSLLMAAMMDVLLRVPPMVEKHTHGIWDWQLKADYAEKYNEMLPADWLQIVDKSDYVHLEKCHNNYVIRHCQPGDSLQTTQNWNPTSISEVSVPSNTIQFGEDGKLHAEVTCIMSTNEIWCRQTEENDTFSEMTGKMEMFYEANAHSLKIESLSVGGFYITKYDNVWYRIKAVRVVESEVLCFFIDYGDEVLVPKDSLCKFRREFAVCQAQAFVCRLVGLEDLFEISQYSENFACLQYKQVILELDSESSDDNEDVTLPVYMYDCETGDSINEKMIRLLTLESASTIFEKDCVRDVYVSNIESNGDVYVQLRSLGYNNLQKLLTDLETQILENPPTGLVSPVTKQNSKDKLYFAKNKLDGRWHRVKLIDWSPKEDLAQIYYVDYGNTDVITARQEILYPLQELSDILSQYPAQATRIKMAMEQIPKEFKTFAEKTMPPDQIVIMKIISYDAQNIPEAEFYKRHSDESLFCINKSIAMESELRKFTMDMNQKMNRNSLKVVPSGGMLKTPDIPKKGEYFEVHIPLAVNPYNFFVQPFASLQKLNRLMDQLQERYKHVEFSPLQVEQIVPGNIYVSKHDDGNWYRTSVIKVIHSGSISVFYCDFGYYANLTVQQLIPLDLEFMDLPYQALKAKMANIKPKNSKWSVDDCDHFKKMVEHKHFFSIVLDVEKDELYESDLVLSLILIDTSLEDDVYISNELVKHNVAVQV